jgi:hypothetical protein
MDYNKALRETIDHLASDAGIAAIAADPYWPKWNGPWWRMTLLWEMGLAEIIPERAVRAMVTGLNEHYLRYFPVAENDLPPGKDVYRHSACHCMIGTIFQVLHACGVRVDDEIPWLREWIMKYQLADGGWNCDNGVTRCSSFVSTLPPAEAILNCTDRPFTPEEKNCLDRTAAYLLERRLAHSRSKNSLIDPEWLIPCFPRFYWYDVLRGLIFLTRWAVKTGAVLPADNLQEARAALDEYFSRENPLPRRSQLTARTLRLAGTEWKKQPAAGSFPLLDLSAQSEIGGARLREEWENTQRFFTTKDTKQN